MIRRPALGLATLAGLLLTLAGCRGDRPAYDNLILVTVDTLRADHLGLYGYPRPTSPYLDQLGREGVVFWHAVAASSHTAPSHATILTSLYPEQHRVLVNGQPLAPGIPALAGIARQAGLDTAAFVSVRFLAGLQPGFETFDATVADGEIFRTADHTVGQAIEWLRGRDRRRRFALWVHVYDPHQHVAGTRMPEPWYRAMQDDASRRGKELLYFLQQEQGYPRDEVSASFDRYDAQIAFVDDQIRRLFEAAAETAPAARTLRVVTADHGEGLGNHNFEGHGRNLYQEQVRAPLIVHGDTARLRNAVVTQLVRHVDLLPTLLELLGTPAESLRGEGVSLVALLEQPRAHLAIAPALSQRRPPDERRMSIGWEPGSKLAAQDERFKYIRNPEPPHEFYDLQKDPYELRNLILGLGPSPDEQRLREWLHGKYESLVLDHRAETLSDEIDPRILEDLKALGYIQESADPSE